jgi:glycosyltransferase involved in cell wall biosynthesis
VNQLEELNNELTPKYALFINFSERMVDSPRQSRQMKMLSESYQILTIGIGPAPQWSVRHYDATNQSAKTFAGRILFLCRTAVFAFSSFFGLWQLADRFQTFDRTTKIPLAIKRDLKFSDVSLVCGRDLHSLWLSKALCPDTFLWIDLPDYTPQQQADKWWWRVTWGRYFRRMATQLPLQADVISTVSHGLANRYINEYAVTTELLRNSAEFRPIDRLGQEVTKSPFKLVHSGAAIRSRGLETMIDAVRHLGDVTLDLVLVPTDMAYLIELENSCSQTTNCSVIAPVRRSEIVEQLREYDAALIVIQPTNFNYTHCLPNKFFEAIQARTPIITGPTPDMKRIVEEFQIGCVADGFDCESISEAIMQLVTILKGKEAVTLSTQLNLCAKKVSAEVEDEEFLKLLSTKLKSFSARKQPSYPA